MSEDNGLDFKLTEPVTKEIIELLRSEKYNQAYNRCFQEDVTFAVFKTTMRYLKRKDYVPHEHTDLWYSIKELLGTIQPGPSNLFFMSSTYLPGNGVAESIIVREDKKAIAYLTYAAVGLHENPTRPPMPDEQLSAIIEEYSNTKDIKRIDTVTTKMLNIVELDTEEMWSVPIAGPTADGARFGDYSIAKLVAYVDHQIVLLVSLEDRKQFIVWNCQKEFSGPERIEKVIDLQIPNNCYTIDKIGKRIIYVDANKQSLEVVLLTGKHTASFGLTLPDGMAMENLRSIEMDSKGNTVVFLFNGDPDSSRWAMGIGLVSHEELQDVPSIKLRWFEYSDLALTQGLVRTANGPLFANQADSIEITGRAFYVMDNTGRLYTIAISDIYRSSEELDSTLLLQQFQYEYSKQVVKGIAHIPMLVVSKRSPKAFSYYSEEQEIHMWDIASRSLVARIPANKGIDEMYLALDDTLLVTKSYNMGNPKGEVSISFLDYLLLYLDSPVNYDARHLMLWDRLKDILGAEKPEIKLIEELIRYFMKKKEEM